MKFSPRPSLRSPFALLVGLLLAACSQAAPDGAGRAASADEVMTSSPEAVNLASADGRTIAFTYGAQQIQVDGDSTTHTASNVAITVGNVGSASTVRVVVIDLCGDPRVGSAFQLVDACDLARGDDGTFRASMRSCQETERADNVDSHFPDVLVDFSDVSGEDVRCRQQVAVVVDGQWLTDPINGSHNFNFQFNFE
jgi:hypothetical protein